MSSQEHGTLELAVTTASTLPQILREFRNKRPDIHFMCKCSPRRKWLRFFIEERLILLVLTSYKREDIECQIMFIDPILVAVPKGHRLANRNSISLTELRDECFVGVKRGYGTRDLVDSICKSVGFEPTYVYEGDEPARLSSLVEAELA